MAENKFFNSTSESCPMTDEIYKSIRAFQKFAIPSICVFGILGNLMALGVFLHRTFQKKSCILYLVGKCTVDTIFLMSLFVVWLTRLDVDVFNTHGVCQLIIFITYIFGFMSVWFVVCITFESYICIAREHLVPKVCSMDTAKGALLALGLLGIGIYNFPLWTTGIVIFNGTSQCSMLERYMHLNQGLTYADTVLTLALPCLLILLLLVGIVLSVYSSYKRQQRLRRLGRHRRFFFLSSPQGRVARMLLAVSIIFFIFHTPSHAIRLRLMIASFSRPELPLAELKLQRVFEMLYYVNFSSNCLTYFVFGKSFRETFLATYCGWFLPRGPRACLQRDETGITQGDGVSSKETEMVLMNSNEKLPPTESIASDSVYAA